MRPAKLREKIYEKGKGVLFCAMILLRTIKNCLRRHQSLYLLWSRL